MKESKIIERLDNLGLKFYESKYVVKNIKGRGFPDTEEVEALLGFKLKEDKWSQFVWDEIYFLFNSFREAMKELGYEAVCVGRSGGYWGVEYDGRFNVKDYKKMIEIINGICKEAETASYWASFIEANEFQKFLKAS